jgi:ribosomal peptide maturation radical SAM protein 1
VGNHPGLPGLKNPPKNPCVEYGIKKLYFVDLILPHRFFESLLPRLARADLGLTIFYEVKSNLTYHQIELLASAGVRLLQPGIESLSTPILRLMRKGVTGFQNLRLLKWAAELGVDVAWNLLYDFPGEDKGEYTQMAALVPLISHLQPPHAGCRRVRIDRFSPLFSDKDRFGHKSLSPYPAYETVFGLPPERLGKLAYYFEPMAADRDETCREAHQELIEAVDGWIGALGQSSFSILTRGDRFLVFDRRSGTEPRDLELQDLDRAVYAACEEGATVRSLTEATVATERQVVKVLERFVRDRLVVPLDGHFLGLAVRMDRWVPAGTAEALLGPVCNAIHRARMLALQKPEPAARDRLPFVEMLDHRHFPTNARLDRVLEKGGSHA